MKKSVNNCIGYMGQIPKNHDVRKFEKSAPSKIEIFVEISMFFYDMVNRPASRDLKPIFETDFSRRARWYQFPIFVYQSDFFKNRLKLKFFKFWVFYKEKKKSKT